MKIVRYTDDLKVMVSTPLKRSEDPGRVRSAIENVLGAGVSLKERDGQIQFVGFDEEFLYPLYEAIRKRRTLAVARRLLLNQAEEGKTHILLNKQAAFVGILVLCEDEAESPMGPIEMTIETKNLESFIDWLAGEK